MAGLIDLYMYVYIYIMRIDESTWNVSHDAPTTELDNWASFIHTYIYIYAQSYFIQLIYYTNNLCPIIILLTLYSTHNILQDK